MKKLTKKLRLVLMLLCAMIFILFSITPKLEAGEEVKGGPIIKRNGQILSVGSAKINLKPTPLTLEKIPGLEYLINVIQTKFNFLEEAQKNLLLMSIRPTRERKYFLIDEKALDEQKKQEILNEFKQYRKKNNIKLQPNDKEDLAVITNKSAKETYILPNFNKLPNDILRASLLFHEGLITIDPPLSNQIIYDALYDMENWLRGTDKLPLFKTLSKIFDDPIIEVMGYGIIDQENVVVADLFSLESILGDNISLNISDINTIEEDHYYTFIIDKNSLYNYLYTQSIKYKNSYFYQFLLKNYRNIKLVIPELQWKLVQHGSEWKLKLLEDSTKFKSETEFNFLFKQDKNQYIFSQILESFTNIASSGELSKVGLEPWSDGFVTRTNRYFHGSHEIQRSDRVRLMRLSTITTLQYATKINCSREFFDKYSSDYLFFELCSNGYLEISNLELLK